MAVNRVVVDINQSIPSDVREDIEREVHDYVWGYIQNKYADKDNVRPVQVGIHTHDASGGACPGCVMHATDGKA